MLDRAREGDVSAPRSRSTSAGSIELAADRAPFICQSQSLNLYLPADIDKWDLHMLHWTAWKRGVKSLYYCRSKSIPRAGFAGQLEKVEQRPARRRRDPHRLRGVPRMSVSRLTKVDPRTLIGKGRIGLLDSTGTYDVDRYAWAYEFWKRQQQTHWMGEEVPLGADFKDWASDRVTRYERALLTQIFRFFTQSDVEVGDNYLKRYIPIFQPLTVQMMMAAFTNMETVHIDAYALLLKTLGMPKTEFEAFRDYSEMRAKADYMHTFGVGTVADVARTLAMFGAFTEGMALFASFAMLLNFPRHNKMNGMGQIVSWSVRDESLHCEGIIRLFHEWNRETGAVTHGGARRHHRCRQDDGEARGRLRRTRLRPRRHRGHEAEGNPRLRALRRRLAADAAQAADRVRLFRDHGRRLRADRSRIRCRGWSKSSTASSTPTSSSSAPPNIPRARAAAPGTATKACGRHSTGGRPRQRPSPETSTV